MSAKRSVIRDLLFRASRARDAEELKDLEEEASKKMGDAVQTETPTGNTGEPATTPEGESLHIHLHSGKDVPSSGAGGSAGTGDEFPDAGHAAGGAAAGGGGDMAALTQAVTSLCAKFDALMAALTGEGGGSEAGGEEQYNGMSEPSDDAMGSYRDEGEERFEPDPNKKIKKGGFGAEAPPGAAGAQNQGSRDRGRGRGRDSITGDSRRFADIVEETLSMAEIICPGIRMPTFDSSAPAVTTLDRMCKFRRRVLNTAHDTDMELHNMIDGLVDGGYSPRASMTCDAVSQVFRAVAQIQRERNNQRMLGRDGGGNGVPAVGPMNMGLRAANPHVEAEGLASLNQRNRQAAEKIWGTGATV